MHIIIKIDYKKIFIHILKYFGTYIYNVVYKRKNENDQAHRP